ncbi:MAG: FTR1 family iron permease [Aphanothece sp. CMT-3BRIN-NPC111]|jgi:high-affinity iron transporter|nr:FTR1 family iron permease [Aphanothece sp. CMT-3BRIN-NPC111]
MRYLQSFRQQRWQWLWALFLSLMLLIITLPSYASSTPQQDMQGLDAYVEQALSKAEAKDFQGSEAAYKQFDKEWFDIEDGVKETSRPAYREIEDEMGEVKFAFSTQPPNQTQVVEALKKLHATNQKFISGEFNQQSQPATTSSNPGKVSITSLMERLSLAEAALSSNDIATAASEIKKFQTDWLEVEGVVATKSKDAYVAIENNMAKASGLLRANPADVQGAKGAIASLKKDLQPFATESLRYNLFDAAVILLREGLEALLVLIALLAFLNKSGNADKSHWLWLGAGAGVLISILTAIIIQQLFSNIASGANRELLEGITGLVAAAMLFYVSYWLHSKSSLMAWQGYIHNQINSALAKNSLFSLALLAFLAVYREGAETTLFYMGIAPSISTADLLGGLALGSVVLAVIAALMLGVGLQIPLKPFFLVTSLLIYYLGFKFVGSGIHALQVAGILPATPANFLPSSDTLGLYPTWETTVPQLVLLLAAFAVVIYSCSHLY